MLALTMVVVGAVVLGPELPHCRLGQPVFRSETTGFVPDMCGEVFVTKDGGQTWAPTRHVKRDLASFQSLSLGGAFADGSVVMGGYFGPRLLRTEDDGATWKDVPIPTSAWLYALVVRGAHGWACGSSGPLIHSADSGRTWTAVEAPTNSDDRCISLDFLDGKQGWVAGWYGSLWSTADGGATWKKLALPAEFASRESSERTLSRVVRVTAALGFVQGNKGTYRTRDGGVTWERLELPATAPRVVAKLGAHRLLSSTDSVAKPADQQLVDLAEVVAARGAGAVSLAGDELRVWSADGTRRVMGVCGAPSGEQPRLETVRVLGAQRSAVGTKRAFVSRDEGATWLELAPLPGLVPFEQLVFAEAHRALAKGAGKVFRSDDAGRTWRETTSALDAMDLATALGGSEDPLSCLSRGATGTVALRFGVNGCFGGSKNELTLTWRPDRGELAVRYDAQLERSPTKKTLGAREVRALLDGLHERATRVEQASGCRSTTAYVATIDVTCKVSGASAHQVVDVESHDCGARPLEPGVGGATSSGVPSGYARALGVHAWALEQ